MTFYAHFFHRFLNIYQAQTIDIPNLISPTRRLLSTVPLSSSVLGPILFAVDTKSSCDAIMS